MTETEAKLLDSQSCTTGTRLTMEADCQTFSIALLRL